MEYNETITLQTDPNITIGYINKWEIENSSVSPQSLTAELKNGSLVVNGSFFFPKKNLKNGDVVKVYYIKSEIKENEEVPKWDPQLIKTITI